MTDNDRKSVPFVAFTSWFNLTRKSTLQRYNNAFLECNYVTEEEPEQNIVRAALFGVHAI